MKQFIKTLFVLSIVTGRSFVYATWSDHLISLKDKVFDYIKRNPKTTAVVGIGTGASIGTSLNNPNVLNQVLNSPIALLTTMGAAGTYAYDNYDMYMKAPIALKKMFAKKPFLTTASAFGLGIVSGFLLNTSQCVRDHTCMFAVGTAGGLFCKQVFRPAPLTFHNGRIVDNHRVVTNHVSDGSDVVHIGNQVIGNGVLQRESRALLTTPHTINVDSALRVRIIHTDQESNYGVRVRADSNILKYIKTSCDNGVLNIGLVGGFITNNSVVCVVRMNTRQLINLSGSGATRIIIKNINNPESIFKINAHGNSTIEIGQLVTGNFECLGTDASVINLPNVNLTNCTMLCTGSSKVTIAGFAINKKLHCSDASSYHGKSLTSNTCTVIANGASNMQINSTNVQLAGQLTGASQAMFYGEPSSNLIQYFDAASYQII